MAEDNIHVQVVTANGVVYEQKASFVSAPGEGGGVGILSGHEPLLAAIADGPVKCSYGDGKSDYIYVGKGILDVCNDEVIFLVRSAETADKIDRARAVASRERAQKRLSEKKPETSLERATASLKRADGRIRTVDLYQGKAE